jgi:hypothetical protein
VKKFKAMQLSAIFMNADLFSSFEFSDNSQSFMNSKAKFIGMFRKSATTSKDTIILSSAIVCCPNFWQKSTEFLTYWLSTGGSFLNSGTNHFARGFVCFT